MTQSIWICGTGVSRRELEKVRVIGTEHDTTHILDGLSPVSGVVKDRTETGRRARTTDSVRSFIPDSREITMTERPALCGVCPEMMQHVCLER